MILSGNEILKERENGNIIIEPFNRSQLNPNSYNLKLSDELLVYSIPHHCDMVKDDSGYIAPGPITQMYPLDMFEKHETERIIIPREGYVLYPGILYLGKTVEYTETHKYLPCLEGRSSIGRLGMTIHVTAGFGDVGFAGNWTLEISCVQPIRIYPFTEVCQIYYQEVKGEIEEYHGRYQGQRDVTASRMFEG